MKENWKNRNCWWLLLALPLLLLFGGCGREDTHQHADEEVYTCPMHPQIVQDKPGQCPICGMDLVKRTSTETDAAHDHTAEDDSLTTELGDLLKPVNEVVVSSIETVQPVQGSREIPIELPGTIEYDTRRIHVIAARFGGRVEQLYVRYNYQPVRKGQKLFEIYSPELVTAQQEFIFLLQTDAKNTVLVAAARKKLSLLGLSPAQINRIASTRQPLYRLAVYSPYDGYVIENVSAQPVPGNVGPASAAGSSGMGGGMSGMGTGSQPGTNVTAPSVTPAVNSRLAVTEGAYINAGQPVFRVINADKVWAVFRSYPGDIANLRKGQPVEILPENGSNQSIMGTVDLVEPFYREGQNTATVRVYLNNPKGTLLSGNLLTGKMNVKSNSALWVPREAVLDLGNRQVAFVKTGTTLRPVAVQTGLQSKDWVQIRSGLSPHDAVAVNAQYLVDNEAFVRVD